MEMDSYDRMETNLTVLCHLGGLAGLFFPLANVFVPLLIWLWKKDEYPVLDRHGIAVVNFHITLTIYFLISAILVFVIIGLPMVIGLLIFAIVVSVKGALLASEGVLYAYPLTIRFVK